jgi:hypothetical protein
MIDLPEPYESKPELLSVEEFPALRTISAAFFASAVLVPRTEPPPPQYVFVPRTQDPEEQIKEEVVLAEWNMSWEWGHVRDERFRDRIPRRLAWIDRHPTLNFRLVPLATEKAGGKLDAYGPIYSLLPLKTLRRFGLPPRSSTWPPSMPWRQTVAANATEQLARAFAFHVWPLLSSRSKPRDFSRTEPLRVLSHSLDFWLPYVDLVVQRRVKALGRVKYEDDDQRRAHEEAQRTLDPALDADVCRPCFGGDAWRGEEDAWVATQEVVDVADEHGRLRDLIDAIKSHRVQDDFSQRWSYEREDFERKLYAKRTKWKVSFVELDDTVPVHSPDAEPEQERQLLWQDFFSVLDEKEKRIVVCLRNGATTATEIAQTLGYANHSPISKALARIRRRATGALR